MQLPSLLNRRNVLATGIAIFFVWFLTSDNDFSSVKTILQRPPHDLFHVSPVSSQAIRDVCAKTQWNSSLVFTCENSRWGVGHVRNGILNCVRYAIAAGGGLVLPIIPRRDVDDEILYKRHGPGRGGMDYMFDTAHFTTSLALSCPELKIMNDIEVPFTVGRRRGLTPEEVVGNTVPTTGLEKPGEWRGQLFDWIDKWIDPEPAEFPMVIDLEQSFLKWPTHSDGHIFAHDLGKILSFRPDIRQLASSLLVALQEKHDIGMKESTEVENHEHMSEQYSFFGAHLRNEQSNREAFEGPTHAAKTKKHMSEPIYNKFLAQTTAYLEQASRSGHKVLYVASGNALEVEHFTAHARGWNLHIESKYSLLPPKAMDRLWWDQRALVDWLVLLKAHESAGVGHSAFSWNVALERHGFHHSHGDGHGKGRLDGDVWRDDPGKSTLYGVLQGYIDSSGCMWP